MKKRIFKYLLFVLLIGVIGLLLPQCKEELPTGGGEYPVDDDPANAPSITSIDPDTAFGGVVITITGDNFNTDDPKLNQIALGTTILLADSVSSNGTTLWFTTPMGYSDDLLDLKVSSVPSPYWSNAVPFYFPTFRIIYMATITLTEAAITDPDKAYKYRTHYNWDLGGYPYNEVDTTWNFQCFPVWSNHRLYVVPSQDSVITDEWMQCANWDFAVATGLPVPNPSPDSIDLTFAVDMLPAVGVVNFESTGVYVVGSMDGWAITPMTFVPLAGQ